MSDARGSVSGQRGVHDVKFFGLSTCAWCKKTRAFLESEGVAFDFVYVDLLSGGERDAVMREVAGYNPQLNFPTVVVDGEVIVGYDEDGLRRVLGS